MNRVRASLREHRLSAKIRRFAAERNLDESQIHDLVASSVIDALDELGTAYGAEMTSIVERMTQVRGQVHEVYQRALSGTIDPSDPTVLRNLLSQLHDEMGRLADPEAWARRQATEPLAAKPGSTEPTAAGTGLAEPTAAEPGAAEPAQAGPPGTGEAPPPKGKARRRRLKDLPPDVRAHVEQLRQAADDAAASTRRGPARAGRLAAWLGLCEIPARAKGWLAAGRLGEHAGRRGQPPGLGHDPQAYLADESNRRAGGAFGRQVDASRSPDFPRPDRNADGGRT